MFRRPTYLGLIYGFCCIILISSCTTDLEFNSSNYDKKLVINSIFYPYEPFKVRLTSSRNILDSNSKIEQVSKAQVLLLNKDGILLEMLTEVGTSGIYRSMEVVAFPGETYTIEVSKDGPDGFTDIYTATSNIPKISLATTLDTSIVSLAKCNKALKINVLIDDLKNVNEDYIFEVELKTKGTLAPLFDFDNDVMVYGDPKTPKRLYLNDTGFDGKLRSLEFLTCEGFSSDNSNGITEIKMFNASKDLYEYYKSLEEYELSKRTINPSSTLPLKVYSNIVRDGDKIGLGIFAGANKKSLILEY